MYICVYTHTFMHTHSIIHVICYVTLYFLTNKRADLHKRARTTRFSAQVIAWVHIKGHVTTRGANAFHRVQLC